MMPVNSCAKWFAAFSTLLIINGAWGDDLATGNARRWSPGGGHYRMVVSSLHHDDTELKPEESVGYPYVHKEKLTKTVDDSDKVTQRVVSKTRKRTRTLTSTDADSAATSARKRRRHQDASSTVQSTTGLPRTMSYNLYNHFRPIEQDVPQEVLLPFLDFGKKLSTPSGFNSIEGSSTPRDSTSSTDKNRNASGEEEEEVHEDMDVAVTVKAVERNIAPRKPVQLRQPTFFRSPTDNESSKTDNSTDLLSNESGVKLHAVLSPNYGLKLNRTAEERYSSEAPVLNQTAATVSEKPNPTARILSTAVVTSVSVKESPRAPRVKPNSSEILDDESRKSETLKSLDQRDESSSLNNTRRKSFVTLRPKTTTLRPVVLRSNRKNSPQGVLHVVSTPPTYIEVPKISPSLIRTTRPRVDNSEAPATETPMKHEMNNTEASTVESLTSFSPGTSTTETTITPSTTQLTSVEATTVKIEATEASTTNIPTTLTESLDDVETTTLADPPPALEIEFKPLAKNSSVDISTRSTTMSPPTTNFSVPFVPDLFWVYGQRNNGSPVKTQPSTIGVTLQGSTLGVVIYILAALGVIPLILGAFLGARQIFLKGKTKVLDESEYSSEYNRSPLPTKLPRLPAHLNWEETKPEPPPIVLTTKWEFPREKLRLQTVLGQGNFGQVWKAEADDISGHEGLTRLVAVKTVKEGASVREKEDLLRELGIMQELGAHPNVVTLLGCCTEKEPYFLIMEYVMYGKMLAFLREHRTRAHYFNFSDLSSALNSRDLTVFAYCVARGMEYICSKGIVHRDLAARNVLVDHNKLCKIADFGMSRNVRDTGEIYEQRPNNRGALPIRWMAPESLHYNIFTQKTDVWSFGILLWEIITLGSTPYNTMGAREVMRQVGDGFRLERPKHCRSEFFRVASKCWSTDPGKRPTFTELKQEIGSLLGTSESEGGYVDLEALAEEMCDQQMH